MTSLAERIIKFNKNRHQKLLQLKYVIMRAGIFRFYRGTCHLFYEDNHNEKLLCNSPSAWICGDLHIENFGAYKGDDRLVYFDINDFDEALLAPCLWDVSRFITSIILAHKTVGIKKEEAILLAQNTLNRYVTTLKGAHTRLIEKETAKGVIKDLLDDLSQRKRKDFIEKRTVEKGGKILLKMDPAKALPVSDEQKEKIKNRIDEWAQNESDPNFYKIQDIAYRIAGAGSLGLERYILLVEGKGKENHYLLDLKIAASSSLQKYTTVKQPGWKNDADRVIEIQQRMQAISPALMHCFRIDSRYFVLKELQPSQDKLDLTLMSSKIKKLQNSMDSFADILAWDQLRSSGRQCSATVDELVDFANRTDWQQQLLDFCLTYFEKVKSDYEEYCKAFDDGEFNDEYAGEIVS